MHLCLFIYFFFIYIYITHVYIISYKKHEDVYIDIYMIYSLRCCDPCQITSQKFYTYVCTYVCASVCPALKSPPSQSFYISLIILLHLFHPVFYRYFLSIIVEPIDRTIDSIYALHTSFSLTCPSEWSLRECVTPCSSLELFRSKRG